MRTFFTLLTLSSIILGSSLNAIPSDEKSQNSKTKSSGVLEKIAPDGYFCEKLPPEICQGDKDSDKFYLYGKFAQTFYYFLRGKSKRIENSYGLQGERLAVWRWIRYLSCEKNLKKESFVCKFENWSQKPVHMTIKGFEAAIMYHLLPNELEEKTGKKPKKAIKKAFWTTCNKKVEDDDKWSCSIGE